MVRFELDDQRNVVLRMLRYLIPPSHEVQDAGLGQVEGKLLMSHRRLVGFSGWKPPTPVIIPRRYLSPASIAALSKKYT